MPNSVSYNILYFSDNKFWVYSEWQACECYIVSGFNYRYLDSIIDIVLMTNSIFSQCLCTLG